MALDDGTLRTFDTGATRDTATDKPEYGGFLSPLVLKRFGEYMHQHRLQSDGNMRDADNWQKGIPTEAYFESLLRHVMDAWLHRWGFHTEANEAYEEALCAALFNVQGLLFECLKVAPGPVVPPMNGPYPADHPSFIEAVETGNKVWCESQAGADVLLDAVRARNPDRAVICLPGHEVVPGESGFYVYLV